MMFRSGPHRANSALTGGWRYGLATAALCALIVPASPANATSNAYVPCAGPGGGAEGLITAINAANMAGGGAISLASQCVYTLTAPAVAATSDPNDGADGLPIIVTPISISGRSTAIVRSSGTPFRLLKVASNGSLILNGLTLSGGLGSVTGGAILNQGGTVRVINTVITGNTAVALFALGNLGYPAVLGSGGAIANGTANGGTLGTLTLVGSSVAGNSAKDSGGGILNAAVMTLIDSSVTGNTADVGGGFRNWTGATATLYGTAVSGNTGYYGGGIYNGGDCSYPGCTGTPGVVNLLPDNKGKPTRVIGNATSNCAPVGSVKGCTG